MITRLRMAGDLDRSFWCQGVLQICSIFMGIALYVEFKRSLLNAYIIL